MTPTEALYAITEGHGHTMQSALIEHGGNHVALSAIAYAIYAQALTLASRHPEYAAALVANLIPEAIPHANQQADDIVEVFRITTAGVRQ